MGVKWYQDLFENYGNNYENELYVNGTEVEVDFIEKELDFNRDKYILDIGCKTGRHSIELDKRGYSVVGVDLSPYMIKKAKSKLSDNLDVKFIIKEALKLNYYNDFELTTILCEGAFSLIGNAYNSLKKDGKLINSFLNAYKQLIEENNDFNLVTQREQFVLEIVDDNGNNKNINGEQRYYFLSEIKWRLKNIGFNKIDVYGCKLGEFNRCREFNKNDMEFLVAAKKE